jgi:FtsP/CotA-like multicopper oxidase with cupredoxin domain
VSTSQWTRLAWGVLWLFAALRPFSVHAANYPKTETPHAGTLAYRLEQGVKVFELTAEPVKREMASGLVIKGWGYNGQTPGPTIEANEGDRIRVLLTNHLSEATSIHFHGVLLPSGMDGVSGLNQPRIEPGETYAYEFLLRQHGTQMYHPHADETTQMALGMMGLFVIHPKQEPRRIDRDFAFFLQEWDVTPGASKPNPITMTDFNLFSFNGRVYPHLDPLVVKRGERVRIRFANLTMDSHPIHVHGVSFVQTGTDGGPTPLSAQFPETTINVLPGSTRDFEFIAHTSGDWAMHCHKSHHTMNQMGHDVPNMIGVDQTQDTEAVQKILPEYMAMGSDGMDDMASMHMPGPVNTVPMMSGTGPFGPIGMGGMFLVIKVRDEIDNSSATSWYKSPPTEQAHRVRSGANAQQKSGR